MLKFTFDDFFIKKVHHCVMNNLAKYRKSKGLLQKDVAKMLGIATNTYCCYETGINEPSISVLLNLADIFGVSVDELLGRTSEPGIFDDARVPKTRVQELFDQLTIVDQGRILGKMELMIEEYGDNENARTFNAYK